MPITCDSEIRVLSQDEFHALLHPVLGIVFDVHNEFGRLLDENVFKRIIARRCAAAGLGPVEREVRIRVTHHDFVKEYFMDLLFAHGLMLEAKTVEALAPAHRAQALNYLFLTGMQHGELLNLRSERVQHEFVSTSLDPSARKRFRVVEHDWRDLGPAGATLKALVPELLSDWGAFLEVSLYRQALIHFLAGPEGTSAEVEIRDGDSPVGTQSVPLLDAGIALACTAVSRGHEQVVEHQRRLLAHTNLQAVQWINFNRATVEFTTITE